MLTGFFSNVSGIYYNEQKLASVSHNMSNVNTTGFRRAMMVMRSRQEDPNTSRIDSDVKKRLPSQYGIQRSGIHVAHDQSGSIRHTGNDLDVAIVPELENAFFAVKSKQPGDQTTYYTRNGSLSFGKLDPNQAGSPSVLRVSGHIALDANNQPIQVDPELGPLSVTSAGEVYQGKKRIAELALYRFNKSADPTLQQSANLQALERLGDSLYKIPPSQSSEFHPFRLQVGQAGINRLMVQGSLEGSNVNVFHEMVEMMNASKGASANQAAIKQQMNGLTKLFQLVRR